jgi:hypothetical protein
MPSELWESNGKNMHVSAILKFKPKTLQYFKFIIVMSYITSAVLTLCETSQTPYTSRGK